MTVIDTFRQDSTGLQYHVVIDSIKAVRYHDEISKRLGEAGIYHAWEYCQVINYRRLCFVTCEDRTMFRLMFPSVESSANGW